MRTTLDIDSDVLIAVKEIAKRESRSAGSVVSSLLRRVLVEGIETGDRVHETEAEYGFRPFRKRAGVVTNPLIDKLREESGD